MLSKLILNLFQLEDHLLSVDLFNGVKTYTIEKISENMKNVISTLT